MRCAGSGANSASPSVIVEQYLDFAWSFAESHSVMQSGRIIRKGSTRDETAAEVAHLVNI